MDRLRTDLHAGGAVLERVVDADDFTGQLASLADRQHAQSQLGGHGGTEDEAARFQASYRVDAARVARADQLHKFLERGPVRKQAGNIAEQDARLGKVRDLDQVVLHESGDAVAEFTDHR